MQKKNAEKSPKMPLFCLSDVLHRKTSTPAYLQQSEREKQRLSHPK